MNSVTLAPLRSLVTACCPEALKRSTYNRDAFEVKEGFYESPETLINAATCKISAHEVLLVRMRTSSYNEHQLQHIRLSLLQYAELDHPNLVHVYLAFEEAGCLYIITERPEQGPLSNILPVTSSSITERQAVVTYLGSLLRVAHYLRRSWGPMVLLIPSLMWSHKTTDQGAIKETIKLAVSLLPTLSLTSYNPMDLVYLSPRLLSAMLKEEQRGDGGSSSSSLPSSRVPGPNFTTDLTSTLDTVPIEGDLVWALGMIAYQLLVGTHPYQSHGGKPAKRPPADAQQVCKPELNTGMEPREAGSIPASQSVFMEARCLLHRMTSTKVEPPMWLSDRCRAFLTSTLNPNPSRRISLISLLTHPWLSIHLAATFGELPEHAINLAAGQVTREEVPALLDAQGQPLQEIAGDDKASLDIKRGLRGTCQVVFQTVLHEGEVGARLDEHNDGMEEEHEALVSPADQPVQAPDSLLWRHVDSQQQEESAEVAQKKKSSLVPAIETVFKGKKWKKVVATESIPFEEMEKRPLPAAPPLSVVLAPTSSVPDPLKAKQPSPVKAKSNIRGNKAEAVRTATSPARKVNKK